MDATYLHGRLGKTLQVCSKTVVIAMGVNSDGRSELVGCRWATAKVSPSGLSSSVA